MANTDQAKFPPAPTAAFPISSSLAIGQDNTQPTGVNHQPIV